MQTHASVIACHFFLVGLLPEDIISAKTFPSVHRGELVCVAYEAYYAAYAGYIELPIDFEHAILLATALAQRDEVDLGRCGDCGGMLLIYRLAKDTEVARLCEACRFPNSDAKISLRLNQTSISEPEQMQLFEGTEEAEPSGLNVSPANTCSTNADGKNLRATVAAEASTETKDTI